MPHAGRVRMTGTAMELVSRILPDFYATLEDESRWPRVLDAICSELKLSSAAVQVLDGDGTTFNECWTVRDSRSFRVAARHDELVNNGTNPRLGLRPRKFSSLGGALLSDFDSFPQGDSELADFRARLSMCAMGPGIWLSMPMPEDRHISFILHRRVEDACSLRREAEFLEALEPHLDRFVRLSDQNRQSSRPVLEQVLAHVRIGVVLVKTGSVVSWHNAAAERILISSPHLTLRADRLCAARGADQRQLEQLISDPAQYHGGLLVIGRDSGQPVEVRAVRTNSGSGWCWNGGAISTALFLVEPEEALMPEATEISALAGLSPAESRLVAALVSGSGLDQFASCRGISLGTARVQLKQALAKTATHRQSLLVGRMLRSVLSQTHA